jgi:aspartate/methionine/tyrosine aminotransferase
MKIREFGVEIWMNEFENDCTYNLAETCVESLTIAELLALCGTDETALDDLLPMKMTYGAIEGSDRLRDAVSGLYDSQKRENIIITHGTIGANALIHQTLISRGDHVVSVLPTYQQHYSIPESIGADVSILPLRWENGFLPDLDELKQSIRPDTRLIAINNPNNPTGALMDREFLMQIVEIARGCGAWLLCDEVYRGSDQAGDGMTASVADLYEKGISTAGVSKVFSLAGLRLGWIAGPVDVIHAVSIHRDYNTISVGMIDDHFAAMALENRDPILARTRTITRNNLAVLADWVAQEPSIDWIKPQSATVAMLKYDFDMPSRDFCVRLLQETGVMLTPGSAMDMEGYLRIGYANNIAVLRDGLARMGAFLVRLRAGE